MLYLRLSNLLVSQIQDNIVLANIPDLKSLDLAGYQVQDNMGLANMSDLRHLDLVVNEVHGNDHPSLARLRE